MLFRKIILNAVVVGFITGLVLTLCQQLQVAPIIFAAEEYEVAEDVSITDSNHHEHAEEGHHDAEAWAPEDGSERLIFSVISNVSAGIGFAAIMLTLMSMVKLQGRSDVTLIKGLLWGVAGFISFFLSPGLGLAPEIPGVEAAALEYRQLWWGLAVVATAVGLAIIAFAKNYFKIIGIALIITPHIIGAPHTSGPEFSHPDSDVVNILSALHHQFIIASGLTNLIFWIALGVISAWTLNRWVLKDSGSAA